MIYKLKPVRCDNCKFYKEDKVYRGEGECSHPLADTKSDGRYTREHRVCNLLPTNEDRRNAKINLYK